jgi:hypothetical protein
MPSYAIHTCQAVFRGLLPCGLFAMNARSQQFRITSAHLVAGIFSSIVDLVSFATWYRLIADIFSHSHFTCSHLLYMLSPHVHTISPSCLFLTCSHLLTFSRSRHLAFSMLPQFLPCTALLHVPPHLTHSPFLGYRWCGKEGLAKILLQIKRGSTAHREFGM